MENLADIEALALKCHSEESKSYISEAMQCYKAGAYRAAIVNTWIAVVYDLIDKIRELKLAGSNPAEELYQQYEKYLDQLEQGNSQGIKSAIEFERNIVDLCRAKLQFFDPSQYTDLQRLQQDRHRSAHPSFQKAGVPYRPSAEQARLHIRNAVVHVLSMPPVQGKEALAELKTLVNSQYFPTEVDKAVEQFKGSALKRPTSALITGFIDQLFFSYINDDRTISYKTLIAMKALFEMHPDIVEQRLSKLLNGQCHKISDENFYMFVSLVSSIKPTWYWLETPAKDKIISYLTNISADLAVLQFPQFFEIPDLSELLKQRICNLHLAPLSFAARHSNIGENIKEELKGRGFELLSQSLSWAETNAVFSDVIFPLFDILNKDDAIRVLEMHHKEGGDIMGSHGFKTFVKKVYESRLLSKDEINNLLGYQEIA